MANMANMDPLVVLIVGMAVVFAGLIVLIGIVKLISLVYNLVFANEKGKGSANKNIGAPIQQAVPSVKTTVGSAAISDKQRAEMIVAISAAIAETIGKPVAGIRIKSIRKLG